MAKRLFDFAVALVALVVISPLLIVLSCWVMLDSKGGVFYRQERVGKNETIFRLFKFRSMRVGSDKAAAITIGRRDPRITRAGHILRALKLDELPQLVNVLLGDMSLVGPRPEVERFTRLYTPEQKQVLSVRPGITDPASIRFRNENEMLEGKEDPVGYYIREIMPVKLAINLEYIRTRSFFGDIGILFRTAYLVFKP